MNELRIAVRQLFRSRGFTAAAVATLGLGIGLVSTQYSLVDGVLLRPLPFPEPHRLYHVAQVSSPGDTQWRPLPIADFLVHREEQKSFEDLAGFQDGNFNLSQAGGPPRRMRGRAVSANFFQVLKAAPGQGRVFLPGEDVPGHPLRVVLSHGFWQQAFGGDPSAVGREVRVNGEVATLVGIMPEGFKFPGNEDCWVTLRLDRSKTGDRVGEHVEVLGRLRRDVLPEEAAAGLGVTQRRIEEGRPEGAATGVHFAVRPIQLAHAGSGTVPLLGTMQAMTLLVLALACGNVANLTLARAASRTRDLAIRGALGAVRGRIVRQLLVESLVLAGLGAGVGLALAGLGVRLLETQVSTRMDVASWIRFELNGRVLLVATLAAVAAGLMAGLWPALRASRLDPAACLKDDQRTGTGLTQGRFGRWLASAQIAFACALVVTAAMLALSAVRSSRVNLSFDPDSLLIGRIELQGGAYEDPASRIRFYDRLVDQVRQTPGVAAAAVSSRDLVNAGVYSPLEIEGVAYDRADQRPGAWLEVVSRDYFRVVNRTAVLGRLFGREDTRATPPVAVVNVSFARRHWPDGDPIGRRIRRGEDNADWATVVGVVPDLAMEGIGNRDPAEGWYLLQDQQAWGWLDLLVRSQGDPAALIPAVRRAVAEIDPEQPVHTIGTLRERTARRVAGLEILGSMAVVFAVTALVLAGVGSYGVLAFSVRRRHREFGVRMALGATGSQVMTLMFRQNTFLSAVAIIIGLALGYVLAMPFGPYLPMVSVTEPWLYVGVGLTLVGVVFLAIYIPARRAARVNPVEALRAE